MNLLIGTLFSPVHYNYLFIIQENVYHSFYTFYSEFIFHYDIFEWRDLYRLIYSKILKILFL